MRGLWTINGICFNLTFYTAKNMYRKIHSYVFANSRQFRFIYMYYATESTLVWSFVLIGFHGKYLCLMPCYQAQLIQTKWNDDGIIQYVYLIPQIIAALVESIFYKTYRNRTHQCYVTCWNLLDPSGNL
jgi:hypothetical protein